MDISQIIFIGLASLAVVAAGNVVLQRNPIYNAIGLIVVLCALAGIFLLLNAPFVAAVQIVVYAGAIMVLFVFVIMLLNIREEEAKIDRRKYLKFLAPPLFIAMIAEVIAVVRLVGPTYDAQPIPSANTAANPAEVLGTVENIATAMFTTYLIPFEAASALILMAIVGSFMLARRDKKEDIDRIERALFEDRADKNAHLRELKKSDEKRKADVAA